MAHDDDGEWGDCNKCGETRCVDPRGGRCEYCGCADPYAEYPDAEWVKGENPHARPGRGADGGEAGATGKDKGAGR